MTLQQCRPGRLDLHLGSQWALENSSASGSLSKESPFRWLDLLDHFSFQKDILRACRAFNTSATYIVWVCVSSPLKLFEGRTGGSLTGQLKRPILAWMLTASRFCPDLARVQQLITSFVHLYILLFSVCPGWLPKYKCTAILWVQWLTWKVAHNFLCWRDPTGCHPSWSDVWLYCSANRGHCVV